MPLVNAPSPANCPIITDASPARLLDAARVAGLTVQAVAGKLQVRGPRHADPLLVRMLLEHKDDLMPVLLGLDGLDPADLREWFGERAAVREYDGGLPRTEAEQAAWAELGSGAGSGVLGMGANDHRPQSGGGTGEARAAG